MATLIYDGEYLDGQANVVSSNADAITVEIHIPRAEWDAAFGADD